MKKKKTIRWQQKIQLKNFSNNSLLSLSCIAKVKNYQEKKNLKNSFWRVENKLKVLILFMGKIQRFCINFEISFNIQVFFSTIAI